MFAGVSGIPASRKALTLRSFTVFSLKWSVCFKYWSDIFGYNLWSCLALIIHEKYFRIICIFLAHFPRLFASNEFNTKRGHYPVSDLVLESKISRVHLHTVPPDTMPSGGINKLGSYPHFSPDFRKLPSRTYFTPDLLPPALFLQVCPCTQTMSCGRSQTVAESWTGW